MSRFKDKIVEKKQALQRQMASMSDAEKIEFLMNKQVGTEVLLEKKEDQVRILIKTNQVLQTDAYHDRLTGLPNLRYFDVVAPTIMEAAIPEEDGDDKKRVNSLVAVFVDVNGLGPINKEYGDKFGDKLLQTAATALKTHFRRTTDLMGRNDIKENIIARKGGDEIVIMLSDTSVDFIEKTMEEINSSTSSEMDGYKIDVKCSFGASVYTGQKDFEEMHTEADRKMQAYKKTAPKSQVTAIGAKQLALKLTFSPQP